MVRAKKGAVIRHLNAPFCLSVNKAIWIWITIFDASIRDSNARDLPLTLNLSTKWRIILLEQFMRKDCICLYFWLLFNDWRECRWEAATEAIMWSWWIVMNFLSDWFEMTLRWFCTMIYVLTTKSTGKNRALDLVQNLPCIHVNSSNDGRDRYVTDTLMITSLTRKYVRYYMDWISTTIVSLNHDLNILQDFDVSCFSLT
jgi:hypothetical protein